MPGKKNDPVLETVQEGLKLSDLLRIELCIPVKEKIDEIEVCLPYIKPWCKPQIGPCTPWVIGICGPSVREIECGPGLLDMEGLPDIKVLTAEMKALTAELNVIKAEIAAFKKNL